MSGSIPAVSIGPQATRDMATYQSSVILAPSSGMHVEQVLGQLPRLRRNTTTNPPNNRLDLSSLLHFDGQSTTLDPYETFPAEAVESLQGELLSPGAFVVECICVEALPPELRTHTQKISATIDAELKRRRNFRPLSQFAVCRGLSVSHHQLHLVSRW